MTCHVARQVGEFERRLRYAREEVWREYASTDAELAGLEPHQAGEFMDDATNETARRVLSQLEERDWQVLAEIDAAEARLSAGTFGICETCARPIPVPRLRALPTTRLCVACEAAAERTVPV